MNGRLVGAVAQNNNTLEFRYDEAWRTSDEAIPLSLSMPLDQADHGDDKISAFMWGLLPDNEVTLNEWAKRFQVSAANCFALLGATGEDCPGAVQFVRPERLEKIRRGDVQWLSTSEFEDLIVGLSKNSGAGRTDTTSGQFSLAGAQAKTALLLDDDRWGIPRGRVPTTHILKPAPHERSGMVENEHFCLELAFRAGLAAAQSRVLSIRDIPVICLQRYDRARNTINQSVRLHQEDLCQALGLHPSRKYQNEGGPGAVDAIRLIGAASSKPAADQDRFVRALAFNFVILGTDAHAKNYAFLIQSRSVVRLAPLYDVTSYLPYAGKEKGIKLAMKIASHYESDQILPRHWEQLCAEASIPSERALAHVRDLIARLPGLSLGLLRKCRSEGLTTPILDQLVDGLWTRAKVLARIYGAEINEETARPL
jgi:serine/threonine-protein kinase HipA